MWNWGKEGQIIVRTFWKSSTLWTCQISMRGPSRSLQISKTFLMLILMKTWMRCSNQLAPTKKKPLCKNSLGKSAIWVDLQLTRYRSIRNSSKRESRTLKTPSTATLTSLSRLWSSSTKMCSKGRERGRRRTEMKDRCNSNSKTSSTRRTSSKSLKLRLMILLSILAMWGWRSSWSSSTTS